MGNDPDKTYLASVGEAALGFITIFFGSIIVGAMIALTVAFI